MERSCKIRFYPNASQIKLINGTLGCCRFIQNKYIEFNIKAYQKNKEFISGYDFAKIINNLKKRSLDYAWINEYSSKAIKDAIMTEEKAFKRFFKTKKGFPKFKSRKRLTRESFFFIKDNIHFDMDKYHIKIPILGKVRVLEKDYLPDILSITSGRIIKDTDKYYLIFIYNTEPKELDEIRNIGLGIDVGIEKYTTIYTGSKIMQIPHFRNEERYKRIKSKIIRLQQVISHKVEINYWRKMNTYLDKHNDEEPNEYYKNIMKGESYHTSNIRKLQRKVSKLYRTLFNIRKDRICNLVYSLVAKVKPEFITIEDLSVSNLISTEKKDGQHQLHEYISESGFYFFKTQLASKCEEYGIELRIADKYFASSKICSKCGHKKKDLKLSDRVYQCEECGNVIDRDANASINLYRTHRYTLLNA